MKSINFLQDMFLLLFAGILSFSCNGPVKGKNGVVYHSAVEYNDYIINRQLNIVQDIIEFADASKIDLDSAGRLLDNDENKAGQLLKEIQEMPPYKGDSAFRDAAGNLFAFYRHLFGNEYRQILGYRKKGEFLDEGDTEATDSIVNHVKLEEEGLDKAVHHAQQNFADQNHFSIEQTDRAKKLEQQLGK